jgi:hypothetical protein
MSPYKDKEYAKMKYWRLRRRNKDRCVDCNSLITDGAIRCQQCDRKIGHNAITDGIRFHSSGRVLTKIYGRWQYRCRVIASDRLGRPLEDGELAHHINGNFQDDRPENLFICTNSEHRDLHNWLAHLYMQEHFGGI